MWKVIDGSDGEYEASSDGEIRNAKTKHILKQFKVSPKTICAVFHGQNWGDKDDM